MRKLLLFLFAVIPLFSSCYDNSKYQPKQSNENLSGDISPKSETDLTPNDSTEKEKDIIMLTEPDPKWVYSESINEMDDSKTYFAYLEAEDLLYFDFPYSGGTSVTLIIRKKSTGTDVMLKISQGQFLSSYNNDIKVRFDNNKAENYSYSEPADHSSTTIFITNRKKFIANLKKSQTLIIQCGFYQEGTRTIKFDTKGFVWDH